MFHYVRQSHLHAYRAMAFYDEHLGSRQSSEESGDAPKREFANGTTSGFLGYGYLVSEDRHIFVKISLLFQLSFAFHTYNDLRLYFVTN